jgi:hypothetical protein
MRSAPHAIRVALIDQHIGEVGAILCATEQSQSAKVTDLIGLRNRLSS